MKLPFHSPTSGSTTPSIGRSGRSTANRPPTTQSGMQLDNGTFRTE